MGRCRRLLLLLLFLLLLLLLLRPILRISAIAGAAAAVCHLTDGTLDC
jgi:hypothetical protein